MEFSRFSCLKVLALSAASCLLVTGSATAKMNIEPIIITGYQYNTNFWKSEVDETAVDTIFVKPGVKFGYETGKTIIDFDFLVEGYWYSDRDTPPEGVRSAGDDNYVGFFGDFSGTYQATERISLGLDDIGSYTRDAAASDDFSDSILRSKYFINRFSPNAYYDFGNRMGLELRYTNTYTDYIDEGEGSNQNAGIFNLFYNFNEQAAIYLGYDVWTRDYEESTSSYLSNRIKLNYEHQFNNLTLNGGAGYHNRNFDEEIFEDLDLFSWNISLEGQDPPAPEEDPKAHMLVKIGQEMNDAGSGNSYYTATRLDVELGYLFLERIVTGINGYIQNSDYQQYRGEETDRDDTTYELSGKIGYKFLRRAEVNFELGYRDRDSNYPGRSYTDTFGIVRLELGMDYGVL